MPGHNFNHFTGKKSSFKALKRKKKNKVKREYKNIKGRSDMSNSDNHNSSSRGISFTGALQIAFIVLKLCEVIDWSWWWVFAPTWIGVALFVLVRVLRR